MTQNYTIKAMISAKQISARVDKLATEINAHFAGTEKLVVVGLLRGSFVFIADLVRHLDLPVEVDFIEASSYGTSTESSREVRILKDLRSPIQDRDVLVVEDIVDTGYTLKHVLIPACIDQNRWAHWRIPIEMIFHGRSMSLFQASQHCATMSS